VAVVVPVVCVALIVLGLIFWWRKRKARKLAEEERRKEVEEYGFNPNNDPTLPPMATNSYGEDGQAGYRGWGTTSNTNGRKASTNLSSGAGGVGLAVSDNGSGAGYHHAASPSDGTIQYSEDGPHSDDSITALGAVPAAASNRNPDIHRGPSNASSAYSAAGRSEGSEESPITGAPPAANYYDDNPYYHDVHSQQNPYSDNPYGGNPPPVIRDVQARRNTRIENPDVFPKQGNAGIAQNF
jgi:hypothetical protein